MKSFSQFIAEIEDVETKPQRPKSLVGTPSEQGNAAREKSQELRNKARERANMKQEIKRDLLGY